MPTSFSKPLNFSWHCVVQFEDLVDVCFSERNGLSPLLEPERRTVRSAYRNAVLACAAYPVLSAFTARKRANNGVILHFA